MSFSKHYAFIYALVFSGTLWANICDRIEYKLNRVGAQTNNLNDRVTDLEEIINGVPSIPFTNWDGDLYPVASATSPVFLSHISTLSTLSRSLSPLRIDDIERFGGIWWRNDEFTTWLAINPFSPDNVIAVCLQDRSNLQRGLGALGLDIFNSLDGGVTWNQSNMVLSRSQGSPGVKTNADFQFIETPSVVFDPSSGTAYIVFVARNFRSNQSADTSPQGEEAIVVIKSTNNGQTWSAPQIIFGDDGVLHWLQHATIWNNPFLPDVVYAAWSDLQFFVGNGNNSIVKFARSVDAGETWEPPVDAVVIDSSVANFAPFEAQVLVDPTDSQHLYLLIKNTQIFTDYAIAGGEGIVAHSHDGGASWATNTILSGIGPNVAQDPDNPGTYIRTAPLSFDASINQITGDLYVTFQTGVLVPPGLGGVLVARSTDGGLTWPTYIPVNPDTLSAQAFNPSIRVDQAGRVGVLYYDFRNHTTGSPALETDAWLAIFNADLSVKLAEIRITPESFDIRQAMRSSLDVIGIPGGPINYFLGEYCKLEFSIFDFLAAFQVTNPPYGIGPSPIPSSTFQVEARNRQDVIFARISA